MSDQGGDRSPAIGGQGLVSAVYQPVIELESGGIVGYEALARGPQGGELERPDALLSAARRAGLLAQVDWECRLAAVAGALDAGLDRSTTLFVNVAPEAVGGSARGDGRAPELWERAERALSVAVELPAAALRDRPRALVRAAHACRERGWTVVLDDVGADRDSLAAVPLVAPDAIKLDMRAARAGGVRRPSLSDVATVLWAEQERTGATIVAEGIETEEELEQARGVGAAYGQGWLWGRPGEIAPVPDAPRAPAVPEELRPRERRARPDGTPFEIVRAARPPHELPATVVAAMSRHVEQIAGEAGGGAVVLASFSAADRFAGRTRVRYRRLAGTATLVGVLAPGMAAQPATGVIGVDVGADDPLREEWSVVVVAPHYAVALAARPVDGGEGAPARRLSLTLTHDRELAVAAARALAARLP